MRHDVPDLARRQSPRTGNLSCGDGPDGLQGWQMSEKLKTQAEANYLAKQKRASHKPKLATLSSDRRALNSMGFRDRPRKVTSCAGHSGDSADVVTQLAFVPRLPAATMPAAASRLCGQVNASSP